MPEVNGTSVRSPRYKAACAQGATAQGLHFFMFKLEQKAYPVAQTLLNDLSSVHVAIAAIVDTSIDGDIWVDDRTDPKLPS
jgi:hypothetical protein